MDASVLAYMIDNSGTISAYFQGRSKGKRAITPSVQLTGITARTKDLLEAYLGFKIRLSSGNRWLCRHPTRLRQFLPEVILHLKHKRKQAEWLMEILQAMPFYGGTPHWALMRASDIRMLNV